MAALSDRDRLTARRKLQAERYGDGKSLLDICLDIRAGINGMADPTCRQELEIDITFLQEVLATWLVTKRNSHEVAIDQAVCDLVKATLRYAKHYYSTNCIN